MRRLLSSSFLRPLRAGRADERFLLSLTHTRLLSPLCSAALPNGLSVAFPMKEHVKEICGVTRDVPDKPDCRVLKKEQRWTKEGESTFIYCRSVQKRKKKKNVAWNVDSWEHHVTCCHFQTPHNERSALLPNRSFLYKTIKNTSVFVTVGGGGGDGERCGGGGELRQTDKSKRVQLKDRQFSTQLNAV